MSDVDLSPRTVGYGTYKHEAETVVPEPTATGAIKTSQGWIRADMIVGVYHEYDYKDSTGTYYSVKIRTSPAVTAYHPVVSRHVADADAIESSDALAQRLWGSP